MLLFLDSEYTDPLQTDFIRIGTFSEDGKHVFYCERSDFNDSLCNGFVRTAVAPHLERVQLADRAGLCKLLAAWFEELSGGITIGSDSFTDYERPLDGEKAADPFAATTMPGTSLASRLA